MVFGESVLNDAVAIVLTRTLLSFNDGSEPNRAHIVRAFAVFIIEFLSSLVVGAGFGVASSFTLSRLDLRSSDEDIVLVVALCFAFPWTAYYFAEALQISGVVTLLFCGIVMAQYTRPRMSAEAAQHASRFFKCTAVAAELFVFIYLGEAVFTFPILHNTVWRLLCVAILACAVGRFHVFFGVQLTNAYRRYQRRADTQFSFGVSVVMWWSGLRGGVAFALASASFGYGDFNAHCGGVSKGGHRAHSEHCPEGRAMTDGLAILQTTLLIGALSIFFLGGSIKDVALCCGVLKSPRVAAQGLSARQHRYAHVPKEVLACEES